MTRRRWWAGAGLLAAATAVLLVAMVLGVRSEGHRPTSSAEALADSGGVSASPADPPAIDGLRAELLEEERALDDGRVSWSVRWRLCWGPVPSAAGYVVTVVSFEGTGAPRETADTCYQLSVASGVAERFGERPGLSEQLDLMVASLSVSVAVRSADGVVGPPSPDVAVGEEYP